MRVRKGLVLGLIVGAVGVMVRPTGFGVRLEDDVALPWLFTTRGPRPAPREVAVVSIDKTSAQQIGMDTRAWPPPRDIHASIVGRLTKAKVSAIVMDVWFDGHRTDSEDRALAAAMTANGAVTLVQRVDRRRLPGMGVETEQLQSPIETLQQSVRGLAPFPLPRKAMTPSFWAFFEMPGGTLPTLPSVALQVHARDSLGRFATVLADAGASGLAGIGDDVRSPHALRISMQSLRRTLHDDQRAASRTIAALHSRTTGLSAAEARSLAALARLYAGPDSHYLNYYGPAGTVETIPFHELLSERPAGARDLAGRVVFVGESGSASLTTSDQPDTYPTVYSTEDGIHLSGAEICATAFANLLTGATLQPLGLWPTVGVLLAFGCAVGFVARVLPGLYAIACCALIAAASAAVALHLFTQGQILVPLAVPMLVQLPLGLFVGLLSRYRDLRKQVPAELDPHGRQQLLRGVCLATDVKGYTSLTEHLTRDQLHDLLDEYHEMLRRLVHAHRGLVWGRGGDSALCVWKTARAGAWLPEWLRRQGRADQIMRWSACLAAIEIRDAIDAFNRRHAASQQLPTRMGLDVGEIGLGAVAGELQAVGPPVNTAARIEGLNRHLATKLLASARVVQGLDGLAVRPVGLFALAGKSDNTAIVEILGLREVVPATLQDICQPFAEALGRFADGAWADAARLFRALHLTHPEDGPTLYYLSLSERYRITPPESGIPTVIHLDFK